MPYSPNRTSKHLSTHQILQAIQHRLHIRSKRDGLQRSPLLHLPQEILLSIVECLLSDLYTPTLLPVIRTCRTLRRVAESVFYKNINLPVRISEVENLLRTLSDRPDLVTHVRAVWWSTTIPRIQKRRFRLGSDHHTPLYTLSESMVPAITHTMEQLLNLLENINTLWIGPNVWSPLLRADKVQAAFSQMNLTRLVFYADEAIPGSIILPIILAQPQLRELRLQSDISWDVPKSLSPTVIPLLSSLSAGIDTARWLVPGRPVHKLRVEVIPPVVPELWSNLTKSTVEVTDLHITHYPRAYGDLDIRGLLSGVAACFQSIEVLTVNGQWVCGPHDWDCTSEEVRARAQELSDSLTSFTKLRSFNFDYAGMNYGCTPTADPFLFWTPYAEAWKERCPSLDEVMIKGDRWSWRAGRIQGRKRVRYEIF